MPENNDTTTGVGTATGTGLAPSPPNPGAHNSPAPIFVSYIYDFVPMDPALGGDAGGKPGTIGQATGGREPKFKVFTYPFIPAPAPNIGHN